MARTPDPEVLSVLGLDARRSQRRVLKIALVLALAGSIAAGAGVSLRHRTTASSPRFRTEKVERRDLRVTVSATGKLQGVNTVEVGAEVTGRVLRVVVDYNDKVSRGQLLAEIDPEQLAAAEDETRAQVLSSESSIRTADATVVEATQTRKRAEEQRKLGLMSDKDWEAASAAAARAEATLASARASLALARATHKAAASKLSKTKIYAPIDGVVLSRSAEPGQTVTAGFQTPVLFKLAEDLTKLELKVDVDEADVGRVREGMDATFTVDAYPQRTFSSHVLSFRNEPKISQNVVTYEAVLSVDNSDKALRPGMTATATITSELLPNVITVPNAALRFVPPVTSQFGPPTGQTRSEQKHVYVLRKGAPSLNAVKTGASDGRVTELVESSVPAGEEVIVDVIETP